jgi:ribose transport system permease protein
MTGASGVANPSPPTWLSVAALRRLMREQPLVPLVGLLLVLMLALHLARPGIINQLWFTNILKFAIPLAILAACQTLTMLTGGIDLSVAVVATMASFVTATQTPVQGPVPAVAMALGAAALVGLVNGIGVGILRVHPLIMTLGMGLVVTGFLNAYQRTVLTSGSAVPAELGWLGSGLSFGVPNSLLIFVPLALVVILGLRRSGYGRLLYALGDNETAARLSGVRVWQVLLVLYVLSGLLAGIAGLMYAGLIKTASLDLVQPYLLPSVAAAVIGGTSIFGGRGGYTGSILGALILTVLASLLTVLKLPEASRQIIFGAIVLAVAAAYTRVTSES